MLAAPSQKGGPIIWPLRARLFHPVFLQQRPRWTGWRPIPPAVVNLPWNGVGHPMLKDVLVEPRVVHELKPRPPTYFKLSGTTKDSSGAALGNCVVDWFNTADDVKISSTTSDANGLFEFRTAGQPPNAYYLVAYKAGSPDVAGTTVNTLVGT